MVYFKTTSSCGVSLKFYSKFLFASDPRICKETKKNKLYGDPPHGKQSLIFALKFIFSMRWTAD